MQKNFFSKTISIGEKKIGLGEPVYILAEAGVNHNGDMELARQLIDKSVEAGADGVKFQTFRAENLILEDVEKAGYQKETTGGSESQFEMLKKLELSVEQTTMLRDYALKCGIQFITTPFDEPSLAMLESLDLPAYKTASTDTTNIPFLRKVALQGKPMIVSTGMAYFSEVEQALREIAKVTRDVVLMQCTGSYPTPELDVHLNVLNTYAAEFDIIIGYSDHSLGIGASPYAVAMGAKVVEKHFTLDKAMSGPDHGASLNPEELKMYVKEIRRVERMLGSDLKFPSFCEIETRKSLQKCLVARETIEEGAVFTEDNLVAKRTGGVGFSPIYFDRMLGSVSRKRFEKNEIIIL